MKTTYQDLDLELTELGYSLRSQDRYWTIFIFEDAPPDVWPDMWGSRLFRLDPDAYDGQMLWGYDPMDHTLFWTSRAEAEAAAAELRELEGMGEVYVINWGDDARAEAWQIGRDSRAPVRTTPKFQGSVRALHAMDEMRQRRYEHFAAAGGQL